MDWTRKMGVLSCTALALFAASAAVAGPIVVRSTGPSAKAFPVGKPLAADAKLPLKPGDIITVLDAGGTRVLKGPGNMAVAGSGGASGSGFAQLIANSGAKQARTGATRSAIGGGPARSTNVWYVDASRSGSHCVIDAATVSLWRPDASAAATLILTSVANGKSVNLDYRAGQSVRAWPADLPVMEGSQFKILLPGAKAPVTMKATLLNAKAEALDSIATALLDKGCSNQLDVLVDGSTQESQIAFVN